MLWLLMCQLTMNFNFVHTIDKVTIFITLLLASALLQIGKFIKRMNSLSL